MDIRNILHKTKKTAAKSPTKTLSFKIVPQNPSVFLNILVDFHSQQERQPKSLLNLSELKNPATTLVTKVLSQPQFLTETLKSGIYFYRELVDNLSGNKILIPYESADLVDLFTVSQTSITNPTGETLPATQSDSQFTGERIIRAGFGNSITILSGRTEKEREKKQITVRFTPHGAYNDRLHDVRFLINLVGRPKKALNLEKEKVWHNFIDSLTKQEKELSTITADLETLGISDKLNPDKLSTKELDELNSLERVLHNDLVVDPADQHIHITLGTQQYEFFIHKNQVINLLTKPFTKRYTLQYKRDDGTFFPINPYTGVREQLHAFPNFSPKLIMSGFEGMDCTDKEAVSYYNYYVLDLLKDYDRSEYEPLLDLANQILDKIKSNLDESILTINEAQIQKRRTKEFSLSVMNSLLTLTDSPDNLTKLSALVLLNQSDVAQAVWNTLSKQQQETFMSWPISYLSSLKNIH